MHVHAFGCLPINPLLMSFFLFLRNALAHARIHQFGLLLYEHSTDRFFHSRDFLFFSFLVLQEQVEPAQPKRSLARTHRPEARLIRTTARRNVALLLRLSSSRTYTASSRNDNFIVHTGNCRHRYFIPFTTAMNFRSLPIPCSIYIKHPGRPLALLFHLPRALGSHLNPIPQELRLDCARVPGSSEQKMSSCGATKTARRRRNDPDD